ncbi:MAG: DNA polymerase IV [Patescibacteria group bacterium]
MTRKILHIDMNSYFATVEQQANPLLRGRPIAVLGSKAKRTIIVASSIEAKRLGIKTASGLNEALKICPELVVIHGEPRKYADVTRRFISIFEEFTDKVEIFSIDEAFLDVTKTANLFGGPEKIASKIKRKIRDEIGSWLSCSIGIGPNKFLAKTGSDLEKPDGLVIINENNKDNILQNLPLERFCGIGRAISRRLSLLDVYTTGDLRKCPIACLKEEFGVISAWKLKQIAYGLDISPVISWREQKLAKSFSCSRTMNRDITSRDEIKKQLLFLFEKVAKKLRDDNYWAKEAGFWFRFKDFSGHGKVFRLGSWCCNGLEFYGLSLKQLSQIHLHQPVRAIGVFAGRVQLSVNVPSSFLPEDKLNQQILETMDSINNRYGEDVITRGVLTGVKLKEVVSGMGRKKF